MSRALRPICQLLCGAGWLAAIAWGQSAGPPSDAELIRQLLERVKQLEARVREIESRGAPAPAISSGHHEESEPAAEASQLPAAVSAPRMMIRGFGDVGYYSNSPELNTKGFGFGQLDLFITSRLSEKLGVLLETVLEANSQNETGLDVERVLLQYRHNQYLNVDVGRYHTSIGYYNTAYHHGTWFQTALGRPFLFAFEDDAGLLPVHSVGVSILGHVPSGALGLRYGFEVGNGRAYGMARSDNVQNRFDLNNGKAVNFSLAAQPKAWPGLRIGGSVYRDRLTPDDGSPILQWIYSGHIVYSRGAVELLNEGVWMRHSLQGGGGQRTTSVPAFYSQGSYRLGAWRPFVRYEYLNAAASDPVVLVAGSHPHLRSIGGGVRYDIAEFAAIKFQLERLALQDRAAFHRAAAQLAFTF